MIQKTFKWSLPSLVFRKTETKTMMGYYFLPEWLKFKTTDNIKVDKEVEPLKLPL